MWRAPGPMPGDDEDTRQPAARLRTRACSGRIAASPAAHAARPKLGGLSSRD
eukprot:CAMPEP_0168488186 /NCGR_PEP_ID=MMETSP0228-20121227/68021_1 /TAXON_ID=133427 /ORGANISM="Protoceratium reticulatum, Strain CCCM 535 (=CCMP 1889)" /LENGTH=51 /DNA_ID=CAMNT_0008504825 /DNA_START=47 /DNA_END=199 /DNA_ORIENTATION=-